MSEFDPAVVALQTKLLAAEAAVKTAGEQLAAFHADVTAYAKGLGVSIPEEPTEGGVSTRSGGSK